MAGKKSSNHKQGDAQAKRRLRVMQIIFVIFSIMIILAMILSAFVTAV